MANEPRSCVQDKCKTTISVIVRRFEGSPTTLAILRKNLSHGLERSSTPANKQHKMTWRQDDEKIFCSDFGLKLRASETVTWPNFHGIGPLQWAIACQEGLILLEVTHCIAMLFYSFASMTWTKTSAATPSRLLRRVRAKARTWASWSHWPSTSSPSRSGTSKPRRKFTISPDQMITR